VWRGSRRRQRLGPQRRQWRPRTLNLRRRLGQHAVVTVLLDTAPCRCPGIGGGARTPLMFAAAAQPASRRSASSFERGADERSGQGRRHRSPVAAGFARRRTVQKKGARYRSGPKCRRRRAPGGGGDSKRHGGAVRRRRQDPAARRAPARRPRRQRWRGGNPPDHGAQRGPKASTPKRSTDGFVEQRRHGRSCVNAARTGDISRRSARYVDGGAPMTRTMSRRCDEPAADVGHQRPVRYRDVFLIEAGADVNSRQPG